MQNTEKQPEEHKLVFRSVLTIARLGVRVEAEATVAGTVVGSPLIGADVFAAAVVC